MLNVHTEGNRCFYQVLLVQYMDYPKLQLAKAKYSVPLLYKKSRNDLKIKKFNHGTFCKQLKTKIEMKYVQYIQGRQFQNCI